jgi:hypothetical protein
MRISWDRTFSAYIADFNIVEFVVFPFDLTTIGWLIGDHVSCPTAWPAHDEQIHWLGVRVCRLSSHVTLTAGPFQQLERD